MTTLQASILRWAQPLLHSKSIDELATALVAPPAVIGESPTGVLVLADPRHELRRLADGGVAVERAGLRFVDALEGVAPLYSTLQSPWCGTYRAADHSLLFPGHSGLTHLALLPLPRTSPIAGVYNVASRGAQPALASLDRAWLDHVASLVLVAVERWLQRARLLQSGQVDPETGWNGRAYFEARRRELVAACLRRKQPAACIVIDVDGLGRINERHGIAAGDAALREIGARIEAQVRASDTFAHLGDDAFAILLPDTSAQAGRALVERILQAIRSAPVALSSRASDEARVSLGVAGFDPSSVPDGVDRKTIADQWLAEALLTLQRAKVAGGDRALFSSAGAASALEK